MLEILAKLAEELDQESLTVEADFIDSLIEKLGTKKWMQEAVNPKEKGELHRKLKVPADEKIPTSLLQSKKKSLQEKAKGDKKLTDAERELLQQIIFALNARK